ncbi:hypothetical protein [Streptacidiphilus carbonis]|uniref:hypothetical protein n=1 Tax=Streptacidiphilus carbonis TaxID=105422 RepID=UPI0005AACAF1|nr:hypothetical protein [Streptacidiphilus carbonis]
MARTVIPVRTTGDHDLDGVTVKYAWPVVATVGNPEHAFERLAQQAQAEGAHCVTGARLVCNSHYSSWVAYGTAEILAPRDHR